MLLEVFLMYGLVSRALHVRQLLLHFLISGGATNGVPYHTSCLEGWLCQLNVKFIAIFFCTVRV